MATKRDFSQVAHDVFMRAAGQAPNVKLPNDFTQTALDVVRQATGEVTAPAPSKKHGGGRKASSTVPQESKKPHPGQ